MLGFDSKYKKRTDGKFWAKNELLRVVLKELQPLSPKLQQDGSIIVSESPVIGLELVSTNYSDKKILEMNASIFFGHGDNTVSWEDLFSYAKSVYGDRHRALSIHRDEEWEGSAIQKEFQEAYVPLLMTFG